MSMEETLRNAANAALQEVGNPDPIVDENEAKPPTKPPFDLAPHHAQVLAKCAIELAGIEEPARVRIIDALRAFSLAPKPDNRRELMLMLFSVLVPYLGRYLDSITAASRLDERMHQTPTGSWGGASWDRAPEVPVAPLTSAGPAGREVVPCDNGFVYIDDGKLWGVFDDGLPMELPTTLGGMARYAQEHMSPEAAVTPPAEALPVAE